MKRRLPSEEDLLGVRGFAHIRKPVVSRGPCPGQAMATPEGGWQCAACKAGRRKPGSIAPAQHRRRVESPFWSVVVGHEGKHRTFGTKSRNYAHALALRRKLLQELWGGRLPWLDEGHTLNDLLKLVEAHYQTEGNRSGRALRLRLKNIRAYPDWRSGEVPARKVTEAAVEAFKAWRRGWPKGNAKGYVNRELAILRQAFRAGHDQLDESQRPMVERVPRIRFFEEAAPRERYAELYEATALLEALRKRGHDDVADLVEFYSLTGRRNEEPRLLQWASCNWFTKTLVIERTKAGEPYELPFGSLPELEALLRRRRSLTDELDLATGKKCQWIFHRAGKPIIRFERAWWTACADIGLDRKSARRLTPHDFRRSQARDVMEATGDPKVAADAVGWNTTAMLMRYRILSRKDRTSAMAKVRELRERKRQEQVEAAEPMKKG